MGQRLRFPCSRSASLGNRERIHVPFHVKQSVGITSSILWITSSHLTTPQVTDVRQPAVERTNRCNCGPCLSTGLFDPLQVRRVRLSGTISGGRSDTEPRTPRGGPRGGRAGHPRAVSRVCSPRAVPRAVARRFRRRVLGQSRWGSAAGSHGGGWESRMRSQPPTRGGPLQAALDNVEPTRCVRSVGPALPRPAWGTDPRGRRPWCHVAP